MSILFVRERHKRDGTYDGVFSTSRRSFLVKAASAEIDDQWITANLRGKYWPREVNGPSIIYISNYKDLHPTNPYIEARKFTARHHEGLTWSLDIEYTNQPETQSQEQLQLVQDLNSDPISLEVVISSSARGYNRAVLQDSEGKAIVNKAGDPFDPPPEEYFEDVTWNFSKNYTAFPSFVYSYRNTINSAGIAIQGISIPAKYAAFRGGAVSERKRSPVQGVYYYTATWSIEASSYSLQPKYLEAGLYRLDGGDKKRILDSDVLSGASDTPVGSPQLLNANGELIVNPTPSSGVFTEFKVYREVSYANLPGVNGNL